MRRAPTRAPSSPAPHARSGERAGPGGDAPLSFAARLAETVQATGSLLCVGLDPGLDVAPTAAAAQAHCERILEAALPHACAVKVNLAFFEQHGGAGYTVLETLRARVPRDRLYILDAKRGDIGNTAEAYARALYDVLGADAVTVNPLMGEDSVRPWLARRGRGCFLLTRTSNPGAADVLERALDGGLPLYAHLADLAGAWDGGAGGVGLVVGATAPSAVAAVRRRAPGLPLLLPGAGAQGGDVVAAVAAGLDGAGGGVLVNVGRAVSASPDGPAEAARRWSERLREARSAAAGA